MSIAVTKRASPPLPPPPPPPPPVSKLAAGENSALVIPASGDTPATISANSTTSTDPVSFISNTPAGKLNNLYGQLAGTMSSLASVHRSVAAAITGKDFNNITAATTEAAFVPQVSDFLHNIIDDGTRVQALGKDADTYTATIKDLNNQISSLEKDQGWTDDQARALIDDSTDGLMKAATTEVANSTAALADAAKTYGQRLDSKAGELLNAWDQSKHNEQKQSIVDAITSAFALFGNVGIGGNAIAQLVTKDAGKWLEDMSGIWNNWGLRMGQVSNLFGAITSTDLQGYANSTPGTESAAVGALDTSGMAHLQKLSDRFQKYVDDYHNQDPSDGGWYIPTI